MYCSQEAFAARFGQAVLDQLLAQAAPGARNDNVGRTYEAAAADADAIVDSYLAMRGVAVPLAEPIPARVLELAADLTRYELYTEAKDETDKGASPAVVVRRKLALEFLDQVAKGKATIPGLFQESRGISADHIEVSAPPRVFTDATLAGY